MERKQIKVVAAVIRKGQMVFATQRGYGNYKDWWEFPGGKIEAGETPKAALEREIMEELNTKIRVEKFLATVEYDYPDFHLSMDCFWCVVEEGNLILLEHESAKWLPLYDLRQVNWLPADVLVIEAIERELTKKTGAFDANDTRLRLFYLYRLLEQHTDEDHPLTTNQLRDLMEKEHGIAMHRTTVYNDIKLLEKAGVYIHCYRARANQYYLESRKFELAELKLLIDAVESSRFMTESQSKSLVNKLITLTSETNAGKLKRNLHVSGRVKAENKQIFYIVDAINEAINAGKRISFQYIDYNSRKQETLRNQGKPYTVSPYSLIWNGDYYYLVGYYHEKEDIRTFRVDRIKQQPEILEDAADAVPEDYDIARYTREVFRMYDTEEAVPVTLVCENEVMKGVLDAFGMDIKVKRASKGHFQTTVMACTSPTFYGWVFQWGGKVQIIAPEEAVREYASMARAAFDKEG